MTALYDEIVMDHIKHARNYRALENADRSAHASNPLCGDELTVYLKFSGGLIDEVGFQCSCCGITMASASIMTGTIEGKRVEEAMRVSYDVIERLNRLERDVEETSLERRAVFETVRKFPTRVNCAALPWMALRTALSGFADTAPRA